MMVLKCMNMNYSVVLYISLLLKNVTLQFCDLNSDCTEEAKSRYTKEANSWSDDLTKKINASVKDYSPCKEGCNCYYDIIEEELVPFSNGITKEQFEDACSKATKYEIIDGKLYREKDCHFPARCAGIEHYLKKLAPKLPNMEIAINTRDWPQFNRAWNHKPAPVFSFSKTLDYYDIMYPAWSFWEGGPAISLYPGGLGRWMEHRKTISAAAKKWDWSKKEEKAFFRGSRTSEERDPLVLLSRSNPLLVDAQYTKNQAWKSDADTLYAAPALEVSLEDHCRYKYLFNYRGVAASFRFKHLFLCSSLVFHVGDRWREFFYPLLKPWVHYVPVDPKSTQEELQKYIEFFKQNDALAKEIADRGYRQVWELVTDESVTCYWDRLLRRYFTLLKYAVVHDKSLIEI